ncbi:hypothetical protein ACIGQC_30365 [Streptomyces albidoflavus]
MGDQLSCVLIWVLLEVPRQGPAVALRDLTRAEQELHLNRQCQQRQLIGDPRAVLTQPLCGSGARATFAAILRADSDELSHTACTLDDVEVLAVQVLCKEVIDEVLPRAGQVVADHEVELVETDVDGAVKPSFAVDQDVLGVRSDSLLVFGPQLQVGVTGDGYAGGELGLP